MLFNTITNITTQLIEYEITSMINQQVNQFIDGLKIYDLKFIGIAPSQMMFQI